MVLDKSFSTSRLFARRLALFSNVRNLQVRSCDIQKPGMLKWVACMQAVGCERSAHDATDTTLPGCSSDQQVPILPWPWVGTSYFQAFIFPLGNDVYRIPSIHLPTSYLIASDISSKERTKIFAQDLRKRTGHGTAQEPDIAAVSLPSPQLASSGFPFNLRLGQALTLLTDGHGRFRR